MIRRTRTLDRMYAAAFAPDGTLITAGGSTTGGIVYGWNAESGLREFAMLGHTRPILCVAVGAQNRLVTGSSDRSVKLWDVGSKREVLTLDGFTRDVTHVAFTRDGKNLIAGTGINRHDILALMSTNTDWPRPKSAPSAAQSDRARCHKTTAENLQGLAPGSPLLEPAKFPTPFSPKRGQTFGKGDIDEAVTQGEARTSVASPSPEFIEQSLVARRQFDPDRPRPGAPEIDYPWGGGAVVERDWAVLISLTDNQDVVRIDLSRNELRPSPSHVILRSRRTPQAVLRQHVFRCPKSRTWTVDVNQPSLQAS